MCGVIGYVGGRRATPRLLGALERLEYRGYDSAGICLLNGRGLESVKAVGKLDNLKAKSSGYVSTATMGIGHTRWATHGRVTEANAHPLICAPDNDVAIVLNGIVENHAELRGMLVREGRSFSSETDAEVVAHLVSRHYEGDLPGAVRAAYGQLEGHFAFIAIHRDDPDVIVGARHQCPLLVGLGDGETFVASAISAFSQETRQIKLIEDGEIVIATAQGARLLAPDGAEAPRETVTVQDDDEVAEKRGFETFMLKEIHEQPEAVARTLARNDQDGVFAGEGLGGIDLRKVRRLVMVACGTAYHACLVGRYALEGWARLPCELEVASEWRYRNPLIDEGTLVLGVSQSGETADTLASIRLARARGAQTLAITNSPGSQITREVDGVLFTQAGIEMGVAATKTFTTQVALLLLLALRLAGLRGTLEPRERERLLAELRTLPRQIARCIEAGHCAIERVADRHRAAPFFLYLGRYVGLPVCLEGALKLKEITYIPTEAYAAGEMKHGPIALLDERTPVVCVATESHVLDKLLSNLEEVRARGASVVVVASEGVAGVERVADDVLCVPRTDPLLAPAVAVVPLQLLAYRIAVLRGLDVDQPRNLAKTVTVE